MKFSIKPFPYENIDVFNLILKASLIEAALETRLS